MALTYIFGFSENSIVYRELGVTHMLPLRNTWRSIRILAYNLHARGTTYNKL